jgi:hypothetical protein
MLRKYEVILKHDHGKVKLIVTTTTAAKAIKLACMAEECPSRAVISVKEIFNG